MSKQFVSLNEALGYLQFLNTDNQAFKGKTFKIGQSLDPENKATTLIRKPSQLPKSVRQAPLHLEVGKNMADDSNNQGKKTLNKNRAIKRIIDTSKELLQANYKYEGPQPNDKKSYKTQFNIYLKQYNRLSEQILAQENQLQEKKRQFIQQEEGQLENVYSFTVEQDFRELAEVSILKDKINKTNVQMVMQTFKLRLVLVRGNQLRIYDPENQQIHRDIKLHEIENVDYFSQPYIFTVMTIVKDKSSSSEYLCFRFECMEKQHKWDRAIYCNYITRKMKRKGKYFLFEFPEKEEEKQNNQGLEHVAKKRDDNRNYEVDRKKIIKNLQGDKQKQKQVTRMGTAGMQSDRDLPTTEKRFTKMQRFNTENQINVNMVSPTANYNNNMMSTKNADANQKYFQSGYKPTKKKEGEMVDMDDDLSGSHITSKPGTGSRQQNAGNLNANANAGGGGSGSNSNSVAGANNSPTLPNNNNNQSTGTQSQTPAPNTATNPNPNPNNPSVNNSQNQLNNPNPKTTNSIVKSPQGKPNQPPKQKQDNNQVIFINQNMAESEIEPSIKTDKKVTNPYTKRKIQLREKHDKGIHVQKKKFFSDKPKIVYLGNQYLEYWDFDSTTLYKSEKKIIQMKDIKISKLVKEKENSYIFLELKNKSLEFIGKLDDLNDILEWLQLQGKEKQYDINKGAKGGKQETVKGAINGGSGNNFLL